MRTTYTHSVLRTLHISLANNDPKLTEIHIEHENIQDDTLASLETALITNTSLLIFYLGHNSITSLGASLLSNVLQHNSTLQEIDLWFNSIGDYGASVLATSLICNSTLLSLGLSSNSIGDAGAMALASSLTFNECLLELRMNGNTIGIQGGNALKQCLQCNTTLMTLGYYGNENYTVVQKQLDGFLAWNAVGSLGLLNWKGLSGICQDRLMLRIWILRQLGQKEFEKWNQELVRVVLGMLKVKDIVERGKPLNIKTWS